jgi:NAD(P)-dependent dehydrogenase (short-subunit alcohol dehydrogenase family)
MRGRSNRRYPAIDLAGAVVLVTGGGRGIGRATALAFAERGARVCIGDRDGRAAEEARAAIGRDARAFTVDVTSRASFAKYVQDALEAYGRIDVLVNNAGVMPLGSFLDQADSISRVTLDVNVWGLVHGMRLVLPAMIAAGRGHIVNVASMAGKIPIPGMAIYNASKFAAVGLTAAVRREFAESGVSVSAVLPGAVRTALASGVPLGRGLPTVNPEVVAEAVIRSVDTRRAEIPVPGFLRGWDLLSAIVPERLMSFGRRMIGDNRALTSVDPAKRGAYEQRVAEQASSREASGG